jgi:hypothetical protein
MPNKNHLVSRASKKGAALVLAGLTVATLGPLSGAGAADHLDAPGTMSPSNRIELDINDVYVFEGRPGTTTLAMTVHPLAGPTSEFADRSVGAYHLRIDTNGDAVPDIAYAFSVRDDKVQVRRATGSQADSPRALGTTLGFATLDEPTTLRDGTKVFAGLRSDPFFFDLSGFLGTVEGRGTDALGNDPTDFFADLNTLALVVEVPDSRLADSIGVWATSSASARLRWSQVDRMGRPAINTVVNSSGPIVGADPNAKNVFNGTKPAGDARYTEAVISALQAFSSLDTEGPYSDAQAAALAGVLLPDVLTFDKSSLLPAPLNGRALADDVIDTELRIITGGDPLGLFDDRDADGGVNSDGVGPHDDYLTVFPYLGVPHS